MISVLVPVRQMHVHDSWAVRDLPVLDATIGLFENSHMVTVTDIAAKTGFDPSVVAQALAALDPVYVDFRKTTTGGDPRFWYVFKVTPEARRVVGQWPTAEALASRLAEELSAAAGREDDPQRQSLLAYAARLIGDTLRDATVRAAGAVLAPAFGGIPVPEIGQQVPPPAPQPDTQFESLVALPELPELLRPQRLDGRDESPAPAPARSEQAPLTVTVQAEPAPATVAVQAESAPPPVTVPAESAQPPAAVQAEPIPPTAPDLTPASEWSAFRPSTAPWPAVDADIADTDAGVADTHPDLAQARLDAV
jgi:hypothetical protein